MQGQLLEREYLTLKEMCNNSRIDFTELDKKFGLSVGTTQYTYHKLVEKGIILRATITMNNPPLKYSAILHIDQLNMYQFTETRRDYIFDIISFMKTPLNKYAFLADFTIPDGIIYIAPIIESDSLSKLEMSLNKKIKGIVVRSSVITDILIGNLEFRRLDYHETSEYGMLKEEYKYTEEEILRKVELAIE